jgi:hypothetical protein
VPGKRLIGRWKLANDGEAMIKPDIDALGVQQCVLLFCFASGTDWNKEPAEALRRRRRRPLFRLDKPRPHRGRTSLAGGRRCKAPALRRLFDARARCTEQAPASTGFDIRAVLCAFEELGLPGHGADCRAVPPSRRPHGLIAERIKKAVEIGCKIAVSEALSIAQHSLGQPLKGRFRGGLREGGVWPVRGQ